MRAGCAPDVAEAEAELIAVVHEPDKLRETTASDSNATSENIDMLLLFFPSTTSNMLSSTQLRGRRTVGRWKVLKKVRRFEREWPDSSDLLVLTF